jgi:predicted AAA+ superfamily ATPase
MYRRRLIDDVLDEVFSDLPAVLLDGPKAVGKTTTALQRAKTVKEMDRPGDRNLAEADSESLTRGEKPILVDEWQKVPETWGVIKRAVDRDFSGGQYLLTGSLPDAATHSGAGRITSLRMRPMSLFERDIATPTVSLRALLRGESDIVGETNIGLAEYSAELMRSGFPALRALEGRALELALDGYVERIIDSDIRQIGVTLRQPATLLAWLTSYAAATATVASWETIRDGAITKGGQPPAKTTTMPYRDALTRLRILDELPPWLPSRNPISRVSQASKHFLADPALAMRLLNFTADTISTAESHGSGRFDRPLVGRMFEALATLSIRSYAEASYARAMHFRDGLGRREVDLIVERDDGKILAIEVKLGDSVDPHDLRHLAWLQEQLGDDLIDAMVVYSGRHAFRMENIAVVPLALLGP